ncbi:unnamed protein product [Pseudo-nitzschia multistriata]|uniref:Uncharacterized protein n=1 Tax=Pseudo-nitzschia multistriata TaxID=183589 RepID=A0A448YUF2_9STRA|nr:unnamed protein product [Pseudo-nitzschia multistriata]
MNGREQSFAVTAILVVGLVLNMIGDRTTAFQSIVLVSRPGRRNRGKFRTNQCHNHNFIHNCRDASLFASPSGKEDIDFNDELDDEKFNEVVSEQPIEFEWRVLQQMLGINIFTVILAALIVFFLSMNIILGPGWLGSTIGIPGTGNIQEVSPTLPGSLDLNRPEYRL